MRSPQAPLPCDDGHHLQPRPSVNTADTPPAGSHRDWQATASPRPGNSPAYQAGRSIGATPQPNAVLGDDIENFLKAAIPRDHAVDRIVLPPPEPACIEGKLEPSLARL